MLKDNKVESNSTLNKLTNTKKSMVSYVQKSNYNPSDNIINSSKNNISENEKSMVSKIMVKCLNNNSANSNKENSLFSKTFEKEGYDNPKEMVTFNNINQVVQNNSLNAKNNTTNTIKSNNNIPASVLEAEQNNYFVYQNGKLYYKGIPFINCQITIINCTVTEGEKGYYTCSILRKGQLIEINVYTSSFLKGNWVLGIPGISILCDKNKFEKWLYLYLNSLANQFDINKTVYVKTLPGWYKDRNRYFYLTKSGIVGQTISNTYSKYGQDIPLSLSSQDNSFLKYPKMVNLTKNSPTATIVILYTTMSFCHAILKEANQTPKFTLFLYGNRGSFKTSVALALSQINNNEVEYNLKSTTAGLEAGFREYKDAVMLVDDLAPTALGTDSAKLKSNLETIVRTFGDSTGIKRNNDYAKNGNQIMQYKASGGAIITGEYITGCESSLARSLYLEVKKQDVDTNLLTELQESSIFTNYIVSFILMLTDQLNSDCDFIKNISKEIKAYKNEFINAYSNSRYAEYHGQLSSIANLILYFGTKYNLISRYDAEYFDGIFKKAISDVISQNSNSLKELSPLNILCDSLINSIESGEQKPNHLNDQDIYYSRHILEDDDFYYITSNSLLSIFKRYIKDNDIHTPDMSVTLIGRLLADNNIIKVFQEGNTVRKAKKIPMHGNTRYFHIYKKELYKNSSLES